MAEPVKTPEVKSLPSKEVLLKHLDNVEQQSIANVAGKTGYNPYVWVKKNVEPLRAAVKVSVTADVAAKIQALQPLVEKK